MIVASLLGTFMGMVVGGSSSPAPGAARPAERDAIRAHIDGIFEAYRAKDRTRLRATHGADWRGFLRPSPNVVRGLDAYMAEAESILGSPTRVLAHRMLEFDVLFHGDFALVSYVAALDLEREGVAVSDKLRVLDVYAKQDGRWNQVGSQVASHPAALAAERQQPQTLAPSDRAELLAAREAVWRAWFANDRGALAAAIPDDTVAINAAEEPWVGRDEILAGAQAFAAGGGKLLRLEFPRTEIRVYGDVAVLYVAYRLETESGGVRQATSGRGTEIFVRRDGRWVNVGWHLDSGR